MANAALVFRSWRWDKGTSSVSWKFIYVALLPLLVFTPAFISGGLVIDMITEEFERKTLGFIARSPVSLLDVVGGKTPGCNCHFTCTVSWLGLLLGLNGIGINNFTESYQWWLLFL
jgi:ABC-type Na+ efflux pump permease subunit